MRENAMKTKNEIRKYFLNPQEEILKGLSPLDAEGKLYMNYTDLMFQLKGKQKTKYTASNTVL